MCTGLYYAGYTHEILCQSEEKNLRVFNSWTVIFP